MKKVKKTNARGMNTKASKRQAKMKARTSIGANLAEIPYADTTSGEMDESRRRYSSSSSKG